MPPVVIAGGIAAAGAIGGAAIGSSAAKKASDKAAATQNSATIAQLQLGRESNALQTQMFNSGMALNRDIYNSNYKTLSPFVGNGLVASNAMNALLNLPQAPEMTSPLSGAYQPIGQQPAPPSATGATAQPLTNALQAGAVPFLRLNN
jgi:hypothetical protein